MFPPFIIFVIILTIQNVCIADDSKVAKSLLYKNNCANKVTCRECINTNNCAWCMLPNFGNRCFDPSFPPREACHQEFIWSPESKQQIYEGRPLTAHGGNEGGTYSTDIVQVTPQKVALNLRRNQIHNLEMSFQQADFPVDLYYLIDLSRSIESDIDKLRKLEALLSTNIKNITSNFRIGFGTFGAKMSNNDDDSDSFHNVMSLTRDLSGFSAKVKLAIDSTRLGTPKSSLDAVMQVTACRQKIGWRYEARRILIVATNAEVPTTNEIFNDSKKPNDGLCHLDSNGYYTHSQVQNYPSVSQISLKVRQNAINTIFAVTPRQIDVYRQLTNYIESSSLAVLADDSSNVVELVKMQYNMMSSTVELKDNSTMDVKLTYYSDCLGGTRIATNKCDGLKVSDVVNFTMEFLIPSCPTDSSKWFDNIEIYPVGINESLRVNLKMLCDCPCEKPNEIISGRFYECDNFSCDRHNELLCSGPEYGTCQCGKCICQPEWTGSACDCKATNDTCMPANGGEICSGHGECVCGECRCETTNDVRFSGPTCEISMERKD